MYYDFSESLPQDLDYMIANTKLKDRFDISTTHMILADAKMEAKDAQAMIKEIDQVDGVSYALGFNSVVGSAVPEEILPSSITDLLKNDKYQLFLINSQYSVASDEVNGQITQINNILKKYDPNGMLIGEAPCTKDLIQVTNHDFNVVNIISIISIFIIIALVLRSISLPVILVAVIEFAVFINLGIPFYTNVSLPFVAPICISTIQLGATVDYAILMTTRYKREPVSRPRQKGSGFHRAFNLHFLYSCQRFGLLRGNLRSWALFQHRHDQLHVQPDGSGCDHQYAVGYVYSTSNASAV